MAPSPSRRTFLTQIDQLPPLPEVVHRVLAMTSFADASARDLAAVLSEDPALAAKILRVANSPFYGARRQVTEVSRAVAMLGFVAVRNLVVGLAGRDALQLCAAVSAEREKLWEHSIAVASAAEIIAGLTSYKPSEEAFVAGLLHDVGQLAMVAFEPASFRRLLREQGRGVGFLTLEREIMGLDHTEAGSRILSRWGLPASLCRVARRHHDRTIDQRVPRTDLLAIVMLADICAQIMGMGFDFPVGESRRAELASKHLDLTEADQLRVLDRLEQRVEEATAMLKVADDESADQATTRTRTVAWITADEGGADGLPQLLLEHQGYGVITFPAAKAERALDAGDLVFVALPEDQAATAREIAQRFRSRGRRRLVMLSDPADGEPLRRRDARTGALCIPRSFTTFDIAWIERQAA